MIWRDAKTDPPTCNGDYLVVREFFAERYISIASFSPHVEELQEWSLEDYSGPLWYDRESDWGYYALYNITHWMPFPELPPKNNFIGEDEHEQTTEASCD